MSDTDEHMIKQAEEAAKTVSRMKDMLDEANRLKRGSSAQSMAVLSKRIAELDAEPMPGLRHLSEAEKNEHRYWMKRTAERQKTEREARHKQLMPPPTNEWPRNQRPKKPTLIRRLINFVDWIDKGK